MVRKRYLLPTLAAAAALVLSAGALTAGAENGGNGNGAPSGPHYNLNLIGFASGQANQIKKTTGSGGNVIHVPLFGNCRIDLTEGAFGVLDDNCSDSTNALFQLPNPDPTNSGTSAYSVFAAARGKPLGSATGQSCFTDITGTYCSAIVLNLSRSFGQDKFTNVTKYLLYVYACINGNIQRVPLFSDSAAQYYWQYDNNGLRNAGLRFYPGVQTNVPPGGGSC